MSIVIEHLNYEYSDSNPAGRKALDDICLEIEEGCFMGIIGHTGSGKSTLVQHLNGLLKKTSGKILVDGEDIDGDDCDRKALRSRVGLVFQYPEHQLFEVDVFSDVCFGPKNMGMTKKDAELKSYAALKLCGVEDDLFYRSPLELSGGQKRRVAMAGVLAMNPKYLILDEPTAGLDPGGRKEILNLISRLKKENNMTIILVSHSMEDVAEYADRIVVMNKGKIVFNDIPTNVFARYKELENMGLKAPEVSYIMHELKEAGFNVDDSITTVDQAVLNIYQRICR
ncbi:MAG: energy-coupling factor transporter ATPase [Lachnospiraceae bacterium]|nr:energy-coupling factor transporter ATPase [Lachnospiraceae bacterium]